MKPKLLMVGDSPTVNTGFANVVRNLAKRFLPHFESIDIWGVNHSGFPHDLPYRIYPGGYGEWNSAAKLSQLTELILASDYTHIWILCDTHNLALPVVGIIEDGKPKQYPFYAVLRKICDQKGAKITFYYPVDSPLTPEEMGMVAVAHQAVTITEYGRRETMKVCDVDPVVIPHGVDTSVFYPREDRGSLREKLFKGWVKEDDFLMVNVNRNEQRKAPHHSLEILKDMIDAGVKAKLLLHMPRTSLREGIDLEEVGRRLGLPCGEHWSHNDAQFKNRNAIVTEDGLNQLYNAADLNLTTTLGEGWGLSITESASAGCKVAVPTHTACAEIEEKFHELGQDRQIIPLPLSTQCVLNQLDLSRIRYPVDVVQSAELLAFIAKTEIHNRYPLNDEVKEWLNWERIAGEFLKVML